MRDFFPSMHADDAAKLPHVDLGELSARVPRVSALIPVHRAKPYDPQKGPMQHNRIGSRGGMDAKAKKEYGRNYQRARRARLAHSKGEARPGADRPRKKEEKK